MIRIEKLIFKQNYPLSIKKGIMIINIGTNEVKTRFNFHCYAFILSKYTTSNVERLTRGYLWTTCLSCSLRCIYRLALKLFDSQIRPSMDYG